MRSAAFVLVLVAPLAAAGDASIGGTANDRCLGAVERALAAEYAGDGREGHECARNGDMLVCFGECDSWSCHTDLCDGWASSLEVSVKPAVGAPTAWTMERLPHGERAYVRRGHGLAARVQLSSDPSSDLAQLHSAEVARAAARARRVIDACLR